MPVIVVVAPPVIPPVTSTSSDGYLTALTDPVGGGVLLKADFSGLLVKPRKVRFVRGDDDTPVRSGHDAWAPGGMAVAYDFEMPLGVASAWRAIPIFATAGVYTVGLTSASTAATLSAPDLNDFADFWLKSVSNPNLSMLLSSRGEWPEFGVAGVNSLTDLPGSSLPGGSWDVGRLQPVTYTFRTDTLSERDQLRTLLDSGPLLIQCLTAFGIADGYYIRESHAEQYFVSPRDPRRNNVIGFRPVFKPPTLGAPLYIPGRSYADIENDYATYAALDAAKDSYADILDS